MAAIQTLNRHD